MGTSSSSVPSEHVLREKCFARILTKLFPDKLILFTYLIRCVISDFRREVVENCALLSYYSASSGDSLPTFQEHHYLLRNIPEERNSLPNTLFTDYFVKKAVGILRV